MNAITSFNAEFRFLSNFWAAIIRVDDMIFLTVENAYQATKTEDLYERRPFMYISPGRAKKLGKKITLRPGWDGMKLHVMEQLLLQKFAATYLKEALLRTGDRELIEGNKWGDTFWGVCEGLGQNHLGKILMKIRKELKEASC